MSGIDTDDIRSAVQAGIMTEAQAAAMIAHVQSRHGYRTQMTADDEPFEFFKGFAEIFVTVGLGLLFWGMFGVLWLLGSSTVAGVGVAIAAVFAARYYTLKRRMTLPSIALAIAFVSAVSWVTFKVMDHGFLINSKQFVITFGIGAVASVVYFIVFRLPFAMFLFGLSVLLLFYAIASDPSDMMRASGGLTRALFDLRNGSALAIASLLYGAAMMALGLWFDMKDPHRISRYSVTGFWLHVLAAPALVNTGAMTLYNMGGTQGYVLTAALLGVVTLVAIVIDRRSFLTAGLFYFIAVLAWATTSSLGDFKGAISVVFVVGLFFTAIGTWWTQIRTTVMTALPNFPGKSKLPPYQRSEV
jgi:hypothetical protein